MSGKWFKLDEGRARCGAPNDLLSAALKSGRVGITAVIKAGRRDWLQHLWIRADLDDFNNRKPTPSRIDDLLSSRAISITLGKNNYIEVALSDQSIKEMVAAAHQFAATGQQISTEVEHFIFGEVRVHEPSLLEELAALGGTADTGTAKESEEAGGVTGEGPLLNGFGKQQSAAQERARLRAAAIEEALKTYTDPPDNVSWKTFCDRVRVCAGKDESKYGWSDDSIEQATREILKGKRGKGDPLLTFSIS